ncbi:hypothetical protein HZC31_02830 [Candidatus Woesearchaeota archaeon]|nr:hypothetical protein [Candidatus Woesearchaeota archaeon]
MTAEQTIDDIASVTTSRWGEDLTKLLETDPYRLLHAYLVKGNRDEARRYHNKILEQQRELADGLGQHVPIEMALGPRYREIQEALYGNGN